MIRTLSIFVRQEFLQVTWTEPIGKEYCANKSRTSSTNWTSWINISTTQLSNANSSLSAPQFSSWGERITCFVRLYLACVTTVASNQQSSGTELTWSIQSSKEKSTRLWSFWSSTTTERIRAESKKKIATILTHSRFEMLGPLGRRKLSWQKTKRLLKPKIEYVW